MCAAKDEVKLLLQRSSSSSSSSSLVLSHERAEAMTSIKWKCLQCFNGIILCVFSLETHITHTHTVHFVFQPSTWTVRSLYYTKCKFIRPEPICTNRFQSHLVPVVRSTLVQSLCKRPTSVINKHTHTSSSTRTNQNEFWILLFFESAKSSYVHGECDTPNIWRLNELRESVAFYCASIP